MTTKGERNFQRTKKRYIPGTGTVNVTKKNSAARFEIKDNLEVPVCSQLF